MNEQGIPNKPNNALLVNFNKNISPRQKDAIGRMSGFGGGEEVRRKITAVIPKLPGASIAIQALRKQMITKGADIAATFLPADCFCRQFNADGVAILSSIVDKRYVSGVSLGQLAQALGFFNELKPETKRQAKDRKAGVKPAEPVVSRNKPAVEVDKYGEGFGEHLTVRRVRLI